MGHMLALSGEAHDAVQDGRRGRAYQTLDVLEFEAKEFERLMGRRLNPEVREAAKRIRKTAKALMKEIKPSEPKPLELEKREPLGRKTIKMIHDVRSLVKEGNSQCGNFPDAELRAKPRPRRR